MAPRAPGLGTDHDRERARQLALFRDGQPCPRCGRPMRYFQALDLDDFPGRRFGGPQVKLLSHARCNRSAGGSAGARITNARRRAGLKPASPARTRSRRRSRW